MLNVEGTALSVTRLWALLPGCASSQGKIGQICRRWACSSILQTQLLCHWEAVAHTHPELRQGCSLPRRLLLALLLLLPTTTRSPPGHVGVKGTKNNGISGKQTLPRGKCPVAAAQNHSHNERPSPQLPAWGQQGQCEHGNFSKCLIKSVKWLNICSLFCSCFEEQI